jgi:hypothetical protein
LEGILVIKAALGATKKLMDPPLLPTPPLQLQQPQPQPLPPNKRN